MFPHAFGKAISLPQLERVRWIMFPEVRVPVQGSLLADDKDELPDIMRVMDLQQEQLARSLGDGHRVIHGVAGSGKTMILGYRAEHLAKVPSAKPILVLCYNKPLAQKLEAQFAAKGLADRVHARNFHKWCRDQLVAYGQPVPEGFGDKVFDAQVDNVIRGVERKQIPSGQYQAVLIDEGHDFRPEWLKLVTQMVDPDDQQPAGAVRQRAGHLRQEQGARLQLQERGHPGRGPHDHPAHQLPQHQADPAHRQPGRGEVPHARGAGRRRRADGAAGELRQGRAGAAGHQACRTPGDEPAKIAELLASAHQEGHAWGDMAVLCRKQAQRDEIARVLKARKLPHSVRKSSGDFDPLADTIKVMTMHASKGLEWPVVALAGVGQMPGENEDEKDEARLFYVAATRATQRLVFAGGSGEFAPSFQSLP